MLMSPLPSDSLYKQILKNLLIEICAFFARSGFTDAARAEAESLGATLVDLERLDADLKEASENV